MDTWKTLYAILASIVGLVAGLIAIYNELWDMFEFQDGATDDVEAPITQPGGSTTQASLLATPPRLSIPATRPTATVVPTSTPLPTATPSSTPTPTLTPSPTPTPTLTPSPTPTPTLTPSPTPTPTLTPSPTPTATRVPQPSSLRADAGPDQVVHPGDLVILDASGSSPDAIYRWERSTIGVANCYTSEGCHDYIESRVILSNPKGLMPFFIAPDLIQGATSYTIWFEMTVSRDGFSATDFVFIRIERPE